METSQVLSFSWEIKPISLLSYYLAHNSDLVSHLSSGYNLVKLFCSDLKIFKYLIFITALIITKPRPGSWFDKIFGDQTCWSDSATRDGAPIVSEMWGLSEWKLITLFNYTPCLPAASLTRPDLFTKLDILSLLSGVEGWLAGCHNIKSFPGT